MDVSRLLADMRTRSPKFSLLLTPSRLISGESKYGQHWMWKQDPILRQVYPPLSPAVPRRSNSSPTISSLEATAGAVEPLREFTSATTKRRERI